MVSYYQWKEHVRITHEHPTNLLFYVRLGPLVKKETILEFQTACKNITSTIECISSLLGGSFRSWLENTTDLKMESQQGWTYGHLDLILSHIQERSNKQDWIINRWVSLT
jgi:hypothetical protein